MPVILTSRIHILPHTGIQKPLNPPLPLNTYALHTPGQAVAAHDAQVSQGGGGACQHVIGAGAFGSGGPAMVLVLRNQQLPETVTVVDMQGFLGRVERGRGERRCVWRGRARGRRGAGG